MHNIQLVTVVVGCFLSFLGVFIIFLLGVVVNYFKESTKNTRDMLIMMNEHKVRIETHERHIQQLFDFHNEDKKHRA